MVVGLSRKAHTHTGRSTASSPTAGSLFKYLGITTPTPALTEWTSPSRIHDMSTFRIKEEMRQAEGEVARRDHLLCSAYIVPTV